MIVDKLAGEYAGFRGDMRGMCISGIEDVHRGKY